LVHCLNLANQAFVDGRKIVFTTLEQKIKSDKTIWFHAASLEYEQGLPVIENQR
jgi:hypothetical protein